MDMRLPNQRKYFGCSSEFYICITTTMNQGNSSVVPVLLKLVNDVFAKLKIFHDYVIGETPKAMFFLPSPFPLQYEGMPTCPSLGTRLSSCRAFLFSYSYVHVSLSHLCARFTVTLMYTVHCHTYVNGPLSHLCIRFTVTLMCTVHCHTYVHGPLSHLCTCFTVTLMCTVHCHTYVHGPLSHLCTRSTVTLMYTFHCHTYVHGSLSHLCKRSIFTLYKKYLSSKCHKIRKDHASYSVP